MQFLYGTKWSWKNIYSCWWTMIHIFWRHGLGNTCAIFLPNVVKQRTIWYDAQIVLPNYFMMYSNLTIFYPTCWYCSITSYKYYHYICSLSRIFTHINVRRNIFSSCVYVMDIWSGHGAAAVLLPGFVISWWWSRVAGRPRLRDLTHVHTPAWFYMCMNLRVHRCVGI